MSRDNRDFDRRLHVDGRGVIHSLIRGAQGNFDALMGFVRNIARVHNSLVDDVADLRNVVERNVETKSRLEGAILDGTTGATGDTGPQGDPGDPGTTLHAELTDVTADQHHAEVHDHDADYVAVADPDWVDLTDAGETALHSHAGGGGSDGSDHGVLDHDDSDTTPAPALGDLLTFDGTNWVATEAADASDPIGGVNLGAYINRKLGGERLFNDEEFIVRPVQTGNWLGHFNTGTNTAVNGSIIVSGHPGVCDLVTGTTAAGRAGFDIGNVTVMNIMTLGLGRLRVGALVRLPSALSDGTDRYDVTVGLANAISIDPAQAIMLSYTDDRNGGDWEGITRSAGGGASEASLDTNVAGAGGGWFFLEVELNADGTQAEFFVNHVSKGTLNTFIPAGPLSFVLGIFKSVGLTSRTASVDYAYILQEFTTPR